MAPKLFNCKEREAIRIEMLDAGFALIKEYGMTHASVEKVTKAVGLGKSTFYNFFSSKEMFVYEIIQYQRDQAKQHFMEILGEREKMTAEEGKAFLKRIIFSADSIYQYLTAEDHAKLRAALPEEYKMDPASEAVVMGGLFKHIAEVRADMDYKVVANLIKIMALALFYKDTVHTDALERTLEKIYMLLFSCIFEEGT